MDLEKEETLKPTYFLLNNFTKKVTNENKHRKNKGNDHMERKENSETNENKYNGLIIYE